MSEQRSDAMKAVNASLTPPEEDRKRPPGEDRPLGGGQEIRAGSGTARTGSTDSAAQPPPGGQTPPEPESNAPPPEATNRDHPGSPGSRAAMPGEGIVRSGEEQGASQPAPLGTPQLAEHARRPESTSSASTPAHVQRGEAASEARRPAGPESSLASSAGALNPATGGPEIRDPDAETECRSISIDPASCAGEAADPRSVRTRPELEAGGGTRMDTSRQPGAPFAHSALPSSLPRAGRKRVQDLMTSDVEVCHPETDVYYAARMMAERDCGAIAVVENTDAMKPVGMITGRDIVLRAIARGRDPHEMKLRDCMSADILTVQADLDLEEALQRMERRQVRRAPVVDRTGRCIGIVAQADIARSASDEQTAEFVKEISESTPHFSAHA